MEEKKLKIARTLSLPIDACTQTFALIGRKGSGKTYGAGKLTELLIDAGVQVTILDSVGNWYGLRLGADGKSDGIDIPIFGGLRGDIPLEVTGGKLLADVVVESGRSLIIDVSQFSKSARQKFATAFGEQLWSLKKAEADPIPLHIVLEESQLIVPEKVSGDTAAMVGIYEEIIRLGRNYGIGVTMITQRPQSVNKEVLNQTECLLVFQVNGAHERKALREWIVHQGMDVKLLDQLPGLKAGECFIWSPQWLEILARVEIAAKRTFDSTKTPKVGSRKLVRKERVLPPLDLEKIKARMKETIERVKRDDPKALQKRIRELEHELNNVERTEKVKEKVVEKHVISDAQLNRLEKAVTKFVSSNATTASLIQAAINNLAPVFGDRREIPRAKKVSVNDELNLQARLLAKHGRVEKSSDKRPKHHETGSADYDAFVKKPKREKVEGDDELKLDKCEKVILSVLAQYPEGMNIRKIALLGGYRISGGFRNSLSYLRSNGLIIGGNKETMALSDVGHELAEYEPLPSPGAGLVEYWLNNGKLGRCEKEILQVLTDAFHTQHREMTLEQIAEATEYEISGGFRNSLSKLRTAGLIVGRNVGEMTAHPDLFERR